MRELHRVALARALAARPRLLVADEPTSMLDASEQARLLVILRELQVERGLGLVFASHDVAVVRKVTDRTVVIEAGRRAAAFSFPLIFNIAHGGALADVRFRQACALALNLPGIVSRLLDGNGLPGNPGFLPPGHPYHVPARRYAYDPAAAERLLDAAGYRRPSPGATRVDRAGTPLRFQILTGNAPVPPVLELLVPAWLAVGIEAGIRAVDLPTLFSQTQQNADQMALTLYPGPGGTSPDADPDMLRTFYSSQIKGRLQGAQGWVDPEFNDLADRQLVTADAAERKRLVARMQQILAAQLPALPLYYPTLLRVLRKSAFDQWYYTPGGLGGGLPSAINKQALVTGAKTGLAIRRRHS